MGLLTLRKTEGRLEVYQGTTRVQFHCVYLDSPMCYDMEIDLPHDKLPHTLKRKFQIPIKCVCGRRHVILVEK